MPKFNLTNSENTRITRDILEDITNKSDYRAQVRTNIKVSQISGKTHDLFNHLEKIGVIKQTPDDPSKEKSPIFVEITEKGQGYLLFMREYGIGE